MFTNVNTPLLLRPLNIVITDILSLARIPRLKHIVCCVKNPVSGLLSIKVCHDKFHYWKPRNQRAAVGVAPSTAVVAIYGSVHRCGETAAHATSPPITEWENLRVLAEEGNKLQCKAWMFYPCTSSFISRLSDSKFSWIKNFLELWVERVFWKQSSEKAWNNSVQHR